MFWLWASIATGGGALVLGMAIEGTVRVRMRRIEMEEKRQELEFKQSMKLLKDNNV